MFRSVGAPLSSITVLPPLRHDLGTIRELQSMNFFHVNISASSMYQFISHLFIIIYYYLLLLFIFIIIYISPRYAGEV